MISKTIKNLCKEPEKIENYEKAVADTELTWHCHHRLEIDDNGNTVMYKADLVEKNLYYERPPEELIFLTPTEHMRLHRNEQWREGIRKAQRESWEDGMRKILVTQNAERRRVEGKTLTGIDQRKSVDHYRHYQRLQHRLWYDKNRESWNDYNYRRKLNKMTLEELEALKTKHENSIKIAEAMERADRKEKLEKQIKTILEIIENKRPTEQELLETMWKHDDLRRIIDSDLENG